MNTYFYAAKVALLLVWLSRSGHSDFQQKCLSPSWCFPAMCAAQSSFTGPWLFPTPRTGSQQTSTSHLYMPPRDTHLSPWTLHSRKKKLPDSFFCGWPVEVIFGDFWTPNPKYPSMHLSRSQQPVQAHEAGGIQQYSVVEDSPTQHYGWAADRSSGIWVLGPVHAGYELRHSRLPQKKILHTAAPV